MIKSRNWQSKSSKTPLIKIRLILLLTSVSMIMILAVFFSFPSRILHLLQSQSTKDVEGLLSPSLEKMDDSIPTIVKLKTSHEESFRKTIHSCNPDEQSSSKNNDNKKKNDCQQHVPTDTKSLQRIAIASPPGISSDTFTTALRRALLRHYYSGDLNAMQTAMELVQTSHVPPYGYGKTHGWTKIVRIVGRPTLLREVFDSMNWAGANGDEGGNSRKGIDELSQVFRQVIRWHCRLSHVAAHSALFSFDFASGGDLETMLVQLLSFLVSIPGSTKEGYGEDIVDMEKVKRVAEDMEPEITSLASSKAFATEINAFFMEDDIGILEDVLMDEFHRSGNLTSWPCMSFWDVMGKGSVGSGSSIMADVSITLAASLVPNCDAPFTKCTVKKDKCEQRGDVLCK